MCVSHYYNSTHGNVMQNYKFPAGYAKWTDRVSRIRS